MSLELTLSLRRDQDEKESLGVSGYEQVQWLHCLGIGSMN